MKIFKFLIVLILLLIIGGLAGGLYFQNHLKEHVINGTTVEGEDISGLTKEELEKKVQLKVQELNSEVVTLSMNDQRKTFKWSQLGISYKEKDLVDKIFNDQKRQPVEQIKLYFERKTKAKEYTVEPYFDEKIFDKMFEESFPDIVKKPVNAKLSIKGKKITIEGGENGLVVDKSLLKERILEANINETQTVSVPLKDTEPEVTVLDIQNMGIKEVIASYKTNFDPGNRGKATNIKLSSSTIDGLILAPGEVFDFNKVVGPRTKAKGYQDATVFSNGQMVDDVGGGICQVSSTMYNSAIFADMDIVERHQHGLPVSYVPLGRDATLWYGSKNFRFKNTTNHHIYIQMEVGKGYLEVNIFGTKSNEDVYIESEMIEKIDPPVREIKDSSMFVGDTKVEKSGSYGYKSVAYKVTRKDGKVVKREKLSTDYYKPTEKIIRVGTKPVENEQEEVPETERPAENTESNSDSE